LWLSEAVFPFLEASSYTKVYLEALLHANMFGLASSLIEVKQLSACCNLFSRLASILSVHMMTFVCNQREQEKMSESSAAFRLYISTVLAVARENLDSASSCDDSAWRTAKAILAVIPDVEDDAEGSDDDEGGEGAEERNARREARAAWRAEVEKERDLMDAVQMLTELKVRQDVLIRSNGTRLGLM